MSKLSENYIAVNEGRMAKSEFLRQSRQMFPNQISQFTSYNDAISIFKSKGMLNEEIEYQCKGDMFPLEQIEKGIQVELDNMGISPMLTPSPEEYKAAKKKAIDNLVKDQLYYVKGEACCCEKCPHTQAEAEKEKGKDYMQKKTEGGMVEVKPKNLQENQTLGKSILKEAISRSVVKVLEEAATINLANLSDENVTVQGLPALLNNLENIVTEIEAFIIKEQEKIQGVFNSIGEIRNEDNIPVGYKFAEPVMDSLKKDLAPVLQKVDFSNIKLPSAPAVEEPLDLAEPEEKETVFSPKEPLAENKKPRAKRFICRIK